MSGDEWMAINECGGMVDRFDGYSGVQCICTDSHPPFASNAVNNMKEAHKYVTPMVQFCLLTCTQPLLYPSLCLNPKICKSLIFRFLFMISSMLMDSELVTVR